MPYPRDKWAENELALFIENDGDLYRQQYTPIVKNYARKRLKGVFSKALALRGIVYLVENGRKKYRRDIGTDPWKGRPLALEEKLAVARILYPGLMDEVRYVVSKMRQERKAKGRR
jgi:hypothetical protein